MLRLHFTRQQLRRTASWVLSAWLFAWVSGVANACLLQPATLGASPVGLSNGQTMAGPAARVTPLERHGAHAHHPPDGESHGPDEDGGNAGCFKFCADETSTQAKSKTSNADLSALVLLASDGWRLATPVAAVAPWQLLERPATVGPPLFLRLLRLTI